MNQIIRFRGTLEKVRGKISHAQVGNVFFSLLVSRGTKHILNFKNALLKYSLAKANNQFKKFKQY